MLPIANILLTATTFLAADVRNGDSGNFGDFVGKPVYLVRKRGLVGCMSPGRGCAPTAESPESPNSPAPGLF